MSSTLTLKAADGTELAAELFEAARPKATVLFAPATGVKRRLYAPLAQWLSERGYTGLTLDYRGIGDSRRGSLRGYQAKAEDWAVQDLAAAISALKERFPSLPLLVVGHSIGGQILGLCPLRGQIDGVVFVAAQSGHWRHWNAPLRYVMAVLWWVLMPFITRLFGYLPMKTFAGGEDLPKGVALQWAAWCRDPKYILGSELARREQGHASLAVKMHAFAFTDDNRYAPKAAVEALLRFYERGDKTLHVVAPEDVGVSKIGHFGAFRPEMANGLWPRLLASLEALA